MQGAPQGGLIGRLAGCPGRVLRGDGKKPGPRWFKAPAGLVARGYIAAGNPLGPNRFSRSYAGIPLATLAHWEKGRSQFLSLRHFSAFVPRKGDSPKNSAVFVHSSRVRESWSS
jgi:hypothetical protein